MGAAALLGDAYTPLPTERASEREERCSVFPVPGRLSRLLPSSARGGTQQRDRQRGGVWWSLERTDDRTRHHVSAHVECRVAARKEQSDATLPCRFQSYPTLWHERLQQMFRFLALSGKGRGTFHVIALCMSFGRVSNLNISHLPNEGQSC